jgi:hypothetical protein
MAFIEVEMIEARFNQLVQLLTSAGPIPIGILHGLGPERLIAEFTWNQVSVGLAPPGFNTSFGTLTARCAVTLRHVSTAELDANPNANGTTTEATAWIRISTNTIELRVDLLAIEVPGAPTQWFALPILVARRRVPAVGGTSLAAAAIILRDDIVTLRFATRATDSLQETPLNMLATIGDEWAIRLSKEFFIEQLLLSLQGALATPPAGTTIEDSPSASWGVKDGNWAAIGKVGLEKEDACPGLLDDADLSIEVDVVLTPSANITPPSPQPPLLNLTLRLSSDVSDWDTFRCWLGGGGLASTILGYLANPIIGPGAGGIVGIISLVVVAETVRLDAGKEITGTSINNFTLVSSSSTTATYTSQNNLPTLVTTAANGASNGQINAATTGPHGMLISGTVLYLPANHNATFVPNGGALASALKNSYDCRRKTWLRKAEIQGVSIEDRANVLGSDLGRVPVTIFNSSTATPPHLWSVDKPKPNEEQLATISESELVKPGDTGRVYLHTSAGIRRFDITPLPALAPPTQEETIEALAQCLKKSKMFTPREKVQWLVDPPPYDFGFRPLRQWLFTFAEVRAGTRIVVHHVLNSVRSDRTMRFVAENTGGVSLELITDAATELVLEHDQEIISDGRVMQRWLIPTAVMDTGESGLSLVRSGPLIAVAQQGGIFMYNLSTGVSRHEVGQLQSAKLASGALEVIEQTRRVLDDRVTDRGVSPPKPKRIVSEEPSAAAPFSLTLPGGKVAALLGSKLVIGIPWQPGRVVLSDL